LQNSLFNRVELLGDVGAGPISFDHCYHTRKVTIRTFQPLCDIGMGRMGMVV